MKNHNKDALYKPKRCRITGFFFYFITGQKNSRRSGKFAGFCTLTYFSWYMTSFTSFTVRVTSGKAAATRLGA